ncbi:MAG: hypothetical protein HFE86_02095 [Clostridiales bacterium]|nr:hypothetical protein [Clostridiales bacterium]
MTGKAVLDQAIGLLGYKSAEELSGRSEILLKGAAAVNQIYADLHYLCSLLPFRPLVSLNETLLLSERAAVDVMPYGVAMLLAQGESDGDNQQLFAELYNRKRSSLSRTDKVRDREPRCGL